MSLLVRSGCIVRIRRKANRRAVLSKCQSEPHAALWVHQLLHINHRYFGPAGDDVSPCIMKDHTAAGREGAAEVDGAEAQLQSRSSSLCSTYHAAWQVKHSTARRYPTPRA